MELFVIPTHRHCLKAIDSIIREMQIFKEKNKGELSLAILDNGDTTVSMSNRNYLNTIKAKHGFEIYYIDTGHMEKLSNCIAREIGIDEKEMGELLIPRKIDYGKIFNLIYLVSMVLNADNLHRRDSDCYFDENCQEEEYSINEENKYLGKAINRVIEDGELEVIDEVNFRDNEKIVIVGSNYVGNWNIDLHELAKKIKMFQQNC